MNAGGEVTSSAIDQVTSTLGALLPVVLRWLVTGAATVLVLAAAWFILSFLWARNEQKTVAVRPFLVVDPSGQLKNAENGFAQLLVARIDDLQARVGASQGVLERAQQAQNLVEERAANPKTSAPPGVPANYAPLLGIVADHQLIQQVPFELKLQGIDVTGLLSWLSAQLRPQEKSMSFTMHIAGDTVAIAGDVRALGIANANTVWMAPDKKSPVQALDHLALQLFRLKLAEQNPYLRDFSPEEFGQLIDHLSEIADAQNTLRSEAERKRRATDLAAYFSGVADRFDDWPAMTLLAAQSARDAGNYSIALKYLTLALQHEEQQTGGDRDEVRLARLRSSVAGISAAQSAQAHSIAAVIAPAAATPRRRPSTDELDPHEVQVLRDGYQALYDQKGNNGYAAIAGLSGFPNFFSRHNSSSAVGGSDLRLFLPWRRAFLLQFESAARTQVADFSLACWDWTKGAIPKIFIEEKQQDGRPNPLVGFFMDLPSTKPPIHRLTTREPSPPEELPTAEHVRDVLARTTWADFAAALEDLSNLVHGWVGGDMSILPTSAYDPLYYAHACMIDRIWAEWQAQHPGAIDERLLDIQLPPFTVKVRDILDTQKLGYVYSAVAPRPEPVH
jgi:tyrosinase